MDKVICELESDKATFELPAEADGILRIIGKEEVTIASWIKKSGEQVGLDEIICELESDKATFELPSPVAGILQIIAQEGSVIPIGGILASVEVGGAVSAPAAALIASAAPTAVAAETNASYAEGHPSPAAAKVMAEKGLSTADVQGSGVGGRITKEDALKANVAPVAATPAVTAAPTIAAVAKESRGSRREKMSSLRKTIARRLVAVKNETAMLTTFNEVDMKPIMDLRKQYKDKFKDTHGVGLGFMSFFTKACSIALQEFPAVNAFIDGDEIVFNDFTDISIAVSAPRGLVVPVIRNAENMTFAQIESE
ncbi:unnamed protein product, partial [Darwinula stevensoni]